MVVKAAPLTAKPPPAVNSPPTLKMPKSDALPIVRLPIYALAVLIVVVEIPLLAVNRPPTPTVPELLKFPLFEILVNDPELPETITPVNPDPSPVNLPLKLPYPAVVENVDIYALAVLIIVVDKPPCKVVNPLTVTPLLKVTKPPTCKPPVVIETAFE